MKNDTVKNSALGKHLLLELYECDSVLLNQIDKIKKILISAVKTANATVIDVSFHHFSPYGISGVVLIAESHLTIHTWPEHGYAAIDLFTCNDNIDFELITNLFIKKFSAKRHHTSFILRGKLANIYETNALN